MALAQKATSMVLALRRKVNIKVRQPLSKLVIPVISDRVREQLEKVKELMLTEVNVKEVEFITDTTGIITKKIKPNFKVLGKRYGAQMKEIAAAFAGLSQPQIGAIQQAGIEGREYVLALPGGPVSLVDGDYEISSEDMPGWLVASEGALTIALDIEVSEELLNEGVARELVNRIQNIRKDSGFDVTDKVSVVIFATEGEREKIEAALASFGEYLKGQTLALDVAVRGLDEAPEGAVQVEWNEADVRISVIR